MSQQFKAKSEEIIAAVRAGATIEDAARNVDVPIATVRRWLRDGRKGTQPYVSFAEAVDGARSDRKAAERALDGPLSAEEAELLLAKAARKGSVPALRLWFEQRAAGETKRRGDGARELLASVFGDDDEH